MEPVILDTNVLSELMRAAPEQAVLAWFDAHATANFFVTAVTQAEIFLGIALLPAGKRKDSLAIAAHNMFQLDFSGRCLPFDSDCAELYADIVAARRSQGLPITTEDAQIAAIAMTHRYALATRNIRDFQQIDGLVLHNPWQ